MDPVNLVCTNTTRFIIPMLFPNSTFDELNKNFIDSYSFDYYEPKYDNKIIIVTKCLDIESLPTPIEIYHRQNQYCFVYDIPLEFKQDYEHILKGRFHLVSEKYYNILSSFWDTDNKITIKYKPIREIYRVTS